MGLLFLTGALYIGLSDPMGPLYVGLGIVSILASITVAYWRAKYPGGREKVDADPSDSN